MNQDFSINQQDVSQNKSDFLNISTNRPLFAKEDVLSPIDSIIKIYDKKHYQQDLKSKKDKQNSPQNFFQSGNKQKQDQVNQQKIQQKSQSKDSQELFTLNNDQNQNANSGTFEKGCKQNNNYIKNNISKTCNSIISKNEKYQQNCQDNIEENDSEKNMEIQDVFNSKEMVQNKSLKQVNKLSQKNLSSFSQEEDNSIHSIDTNLRNKRRQRQNTNLRQSKYITSEMLIRNKTNKQGTGIINEQDQQIIQKQAFQHYQNAIQMGKTERLKQKLFKLLESTEVRRFKNLQQSQLALLNDKSIFVKQNRNINICKYFLNYIDKKFSVLLLKQPFHPFSKFITFFQVLESIVIIIDIFMYTLFCFFDYFVDDLYFYLCISSLCTFLIGTFLRMNTAFFQHGKVISNRQQIFQQYRRDLLINDLIGYVGFCYQVFANNNKQLTKQLSFLLIFKYKVYKLNIEKIEQKLNLTGNQIHAWTLVNLLGSSLALCHTLATAYFFLSFCENYYLGYEDTWAISEDLIGLNPFSQYLQSFFWALKIVTLIDSIYITDIEALFCLITLVITIGLFATILSQVSMVWEEMAKKTKAYKKDNDTLCMFFKIHNIRYDLQAQLHNFLKYSYQGHLQKTSNVDFEELMEKFPVALQQSVKQERYNEKILQFTILNKNFSQKINMKLIDYVKEEYYMPNQIINYKDIYKEPQIYLILAGQVELYQDTGGEGSQLKVLKVGQLFGSNTFFNNTTPQFSAKSSEKTYTTLLTISRTNFKLILNQYGTDEDRERFSQIKDEMAINFKSKKIKYICNICQGNHQENFCKVIHYYPNKIRLFQRINFSIPQQRKKCLRKTVYEGFNAVFHVQELKFCSEQILELPDLRKYIKVIQEHQKLIEKQQEDDERNMLIQSIHPFQLDNSYLTDDMEDDKHDQKNNQSKIRQSQASHVFESKYSPFVRQKTETKNSNRNSFTLVGNSKNRKSSKNQNFQQQKQQYNKIQNVSGVYHSNNSNNSIQINHNQPPKSLETSIEEFNVQDESLLDMDRQNRFINQKNIYQQITKIPNPSQHSPSLQNNSNGEYNRSSNKTLTQIENMLEGNKQNFAKLNSQYQIKTSLANIELGQNKFQTLQRHQSNYVGSLSPNIVGLQKKKSLASISNLEENNDQIPTWADQFIQELDYQNIEFQKAIFDLLNKNQNDNNLEEIEGMEENTFIPLNIDKMQIFQTYYPQFNYNKIIEEYSQYMIIKRKKQKQCNKTSKAFNKVLKATKFITNNKSPHVQKLKSIVSINSVSQIQPQIVPSIKFTSNENKNKQ